MRQLLLLQPFIYLFEIYLQGDISIQKKNLKQSSLITMVLMRRCLDLLILLIYFLQGTVQRHQIFRFSYC